jgi:hypothetical protein
VIFCKISVGIVNGSEFFSIISPVYEELRRFRSDPIGRNVIVRDFEELVQEFENECNLFSFIEN